MHMSVPANAKCFASKSCTALDPYNALHHLDDTRQRTGLVGDMHRLA